MLLGCLEEGKSTDMTREEIEKLLDRAEERFEKEAKLIWLESGKVIFVGDTHGDLEATEKVVERYLKPGNRLVFLGDYVDRGPSSLENINFLLQQKLEHPDSLFLLMGNHEGYEVVGFSPADFWESLDTDLRQRYAEVLTKLPLVVSTSNGIIALHGVLPDVSILEDIDGIELGGNEWYQITWGDWQQTGGRFLGNDPYTGRPQFGQGWFEEAMSRFGKNVLIRSHQPSAPQIMYSGGCLTIFTSSAYRAYATERIIALVDLEREVNTAEDITIEVV